MIDPIATPRRGDPMSADWAAKISTRVNAAHLSAGPGMLVSGDPSGTTIAPAPRTPAYPQSQLHGMPFDIRLGRIGPGVANAGALAVMMRYDSSAVSRGNVTITPSSAHINAQRCGAAGTELYNWVLLELVGTVSDRSYFFRLTNSQPETDEWKSTLAIDEWEVDYDAHASSEYCECLIKIATLTANASGTGGTVRQLYHGCIHLDPIVSDSELVAPGTGGQIGSSVDRIDQSLSTPGGAAMQLHGFATGLPAKSSLADSDMIVLRTVYGNSADRPILKYITWEDIKSILPACDCPLNPGGGTVGDMPPCDTDHQDRRYAYNPCTGAWEDVNSRYWRLGGATATCYGQEIGAAAANGTPVKVVDLLLRTLVGNWIAGAELRVTDRLTCNGGADFDGSVVTIKNTSMLYVNGYAALTGEVHLPGSFWVGTDTYAPTQITVGGTTYTVLAAV